MSDDRRAELRERLTPEQYAVTGGATERPFTGRYADHHEDGTYRCVVCGEPLFDSGTKFESGTGWPSFYEPAAGDAVEDRADTSHGMVRTEVVCGSWRTWATSSPTALAPGLRYCINSASLDFEEREEVVNGAAVIGASSPRCSSRGPPRRPTSRRPSSPASGSSTAFRARRRRHARGGSGEARPARCCCWAETSPADGARDLIARLQSIPRPAGLRAPLLVMVDQEGGLVRRLPGPPGRRAEDRRCRSARRAPPAAAGRLLEASGERRPRACGRRGASRLGPGAGQAALRHHGASRGRRGGPPSPTGCGRRGGRDGQALPGPGGSLRDDRRGARCASISARGAAVGRHGAVRRPDRRGVPLVMLGTAVYPALDPATCRARGASPRASCAAPGLRGVAVTDASTRRPSPRSAGRGPSPCARPRPATS